MQSRDTKRGIPLELILWIAPVVIIALGAAFITPLIGRAVQNENKANTNNERLIVTIQHAPDFAEEPFILLIQNTGNEFAGVSRPFFRQTKLHILDSNNQKSVFSTEADGIDLAQALDPGEKVVWPFSLPSEMKMKSQLTIWVTVKGHESNRLTLTN